MTDNTVRDKSPLVVVFGGAGYIGSILIPMLLDEGYRVRVYDNFLFGKEGIADLSSPLLEVIEADLCDIRAVSSAIKGADSVILLSAIVGHRIKDNPWADTRSINFLASSAALDAAIEHGATRFIFASTNSVYGQQSGIMYETSIPEPESLYSRLKLRMEERVINAKTRYFHPTALRIGTCHGYSKRMRFDLVVNTMIRDAICSGEISVANGEQMRSFIHVRDAARGFVSCLKAHVNLISGEVFNVGHPEQNLQINHLANIIKSFSPETDITFSKAEPDLLAYRLSCSKMEKLLGFEAEVTLEESIKEVMEHFRQQEFKDPYSLRYHNT